MRRRTVLFLLSILIFTLFNWRFPFLRFTNYFANDLFALIVSTIPFVLLLVSIFKVNNLKNKLISIPITILLIPFCLLFLLIIGFKIITLPALKNEKDPSFKRLYQVEDDISIYRLDGGATTAYWIEVRQEEVIFPGIKVVKPLFSSYGSGDILYKKTADHLILIDPDSHEVVEEVIIKSFLYF